MSNIANALKAEIARVARKAIRSELDPLKKASAQHRATIAALRRNVDSLAKALRRAGNARPTPQPAPEQEEGPTHRRFSAARLAAHRKKVGLSAADYGRLVGVSGQSIYKWEAGEVRPRVAQLEALASVRGISAKDAQTRLANAK